MTARGRRALLVCVALSSALLTWHWYTSRDRRVARSAIAWSADHVSHQPHPRQANASGLTASEPPAEAPPSAVPARARPEEILAPPVWHPRPAEEWQGMLVNLNLSPPCESTAFCGLGLACKSGRCAPCLGDGECAPGEICVLDHCISHTLAGCRRRIDCGTDGLCILTGYSNDVRGNRDMRSVCLKTNGGVASIDPPENPTPEPDHRTSLPFDDLFARAREAREAP